MRMVGLVSGGKDSSYNLMQCVVAGHDVVALATLQPQHGVDELDSYMYQSVGVKSIAVYAEAIGVPLYTRAISGQPLTTSTSYIETPGDEVEDLYALLRQVKQECSIEAVSVGAIYSDYQRIRVENVCDRLGLVSFAYLWRRDQHELLQEMVRCGVEAVLIKVAGVGLVPQGHLGKTLAQMLPHLSQLNARYGLHVCGEGGEYETFTLDCPLFKKRIAIEESELVEEAGDVGYLRLKRLQLHDKGNVDSRQSLYERVKTAGVHPPEHYLPDFGAAADTLPDESCATAVDYATCSPVIDACQYNAHDMALTVQQSQY